MILELTELPNDIFKNYKEKVDLKDLSKYLQEGRQDYLENINDLKLEMYNDKEFNKLNDFLFGSFDFIISDRIKNIFKVCTSQHINTKI